MRASARERGAAVVELTLLVPVFVLLLVVVAALGRLGQARADLDGAARDAARAASIARSPDGAVAAAQAEAQTLTTDARLGCADVSAAVDVGRFAPGGTVAVEVSCRVSFSDLSRIAVPGSTTLRARAVAVVDRYRGAG